MSRSGINPWNEITFEDYERHMAHSDVAQMQLLSRIIKEQLEIIPRKERPTASVCILGITNGNGLEHVIPLQIHKVIGIDINHEFLDICSQKFKHLGNRLSLRQMDLMQETALVAKETQDCDLIIANLVIEHIHLVNFVAILKELPPKKRVVSFVIQHNPDGAVASSSGHEHAFDKVVSAIEEANELTLTAAMTTCGYVELCRIVYDLPNGKQFIRFDYIMI